MFGVFDDYANSFDMKNDLIKLKYNHSIRVKDLCIMLARKLNLSPREIYIAQACGLFHDVGRFLQVKYYNSFNDRTTIDHGNLGYKIYDKEIKNQFSFTEDENNIIKSAILYHNKLNVPKDLSDNEKLFLDITRDADKIDILYQAPNWNIFNNIYEDDISKESKLSFENRCCPNIELEKNNNDRILRYFSFVFDLNYIESIIYLKEKGYLQQIYDKLNKNIFEKYYSDVNDYIDSSIQNKRVLKRSK